MKIIFEGQALKLYPFGGPGFSGGTENYIRTIARGLAARGHAVHVVTPDLTTDEQRGEHEWWWGPQNHPSHADVVVAVHNLDSLMGYTAQHFVFAPNGIDPSLGQDDGWGERLSAVACFSQCHIDMLTTSRPSIRPEICHLTGLGVHLEDYQAPAHHMRGRLLWANDPARGLHHLLAIFDLIHKELPESSLLIAYDFERQFDAWRWQGSAMAEQLWLCHERIAQGDGVHDLGDLPRRDLIALQQSCDLHVMPSDPPNLGSQIHGLTQMEMAAAGLPLILSDIEAFPELFGDCADLLPVPGSFRAFDRTHQEMYRYSVDNWAEEAIGILTDKKRWRRQSRACRRVARRHDWSGVLDRWDEMLKGLPLDE